MVAPWGPVSPGFAPRIVVPQRTVLRPTSKEISPTPSIPQRFKGQMIIWRLFDWIFKVQSEIRSWSGFPETASPIGDIFSSHTHHGKQVWPAVLHSSVTVTMPSMTESWWQLNHLVVCPKKNSGNGREAITQTPSIWPSHKCCLSGWRSQRSQGV